MTLALEVFRILPSELGRLATSREIEEILAYYELKAEDKLLEDARHEARNMLNRPKPR